MDQKDVKVSLVSTEKRVIQVSKVNQVAEVLMEDQEKKETGVLMADLDLRVFQAVMQKVVRRESLVNLDKTVGPVSKDHQVYQG